MAAFSYQYYPFHLDSLFLPNSPIKMSGQLEQPNTTTTKPTTSFSQIYPHENPQQSPVCESSCLEHASKVALSNNEPSVTYNKHSTDSSISMLDRLESGEQVTQKVTPVDKKRKNRHGSSFNSVQSKSAREVKEKKQRKCNGVIKDVEEKKGKAVNRKEEMRVGEEAPTGYIHVRARRGQATDSHSLAERVRREKISERMKLLQALVPGCDKVTGKALVLDEIINYVQSLQHQVEFLSMKLASLSPMLYDFGVDLNTIMLSCDQRLSGLATPLPNVQQCNPAQPTVFSEATTTFTTSTASNYPLLDPLSSLVFQQGQTPEVLPQDNGQLLWDVDEQRQKFIDQFANSNNWCSFH